MQIRPKNFSISTQIVAIMAAIVLSSALLIGYFSLHSSNEVYVVVRATTAKGEIRAQFPVKQIQSIFSDREGLGKSGEAFLTDSAGYFLTSTNYSGPIGHSEPIKAMPIVRCLSGAAG